MPRPFRPQPNASRRSRSLRRWLAGLLLLVVASFLGATGRDQCHESEQGPAQAHILCLDDCAPAVIPQAPVPPPADPLPEPAYAEWVARPILTRSLEPETAPPRA